MVDSNRDARQSDNHGWAIATSIALLAGGGLAARKLFKGGAKGAAIPTAKNAPAGAAPRATKAQPTAAQPTPESGHAKVKERLMDDTPAPSAPKPVPDGHFRDGNGDIHKFNRQEDADFYKQRIPAAVERGYLDPDEMDFVLGVGNRTTKL